MIKFGNLTNPGIDVLNEISTIHKMGLDFAEISIEGPEGMPDVLMKNRNAIKRSLKNKKMFGIAHTSWYAELGTLHKPVRKAWVGECKKFIDVAGELGLGKITFHSHSRGMFMTNKESKKRVLDNFVLSMRELVRHSKSVDVMLENSTEKYEIYNINDFEYIVSRVPKLKVNIDIGHTFMHHGMKNVFNYITKFSDMTEHFHFHDNHGKRDEHLPIGKGKINFRKIVSLLKKIGYDNTITMEVFSKNRGEVKKSADKIRRLWG